MNDAALVKLAHEASFASPERFTMGAKAIRPGTRTTRFVAAGPSFVSEVAQLIYDEVYSVHHRSAALVQDRAARELFEKRLSAANRTPATYATGWAIVGRKPDRVLVEHASLGRRVISPEAAERIDEFRVARPSFLPNAQAEFAFYNGRHEPTEERTAPLLRVYFAICAGGAPKLASVITETADQLALPFRFKTLKDPLQFRRADAAVLYLEPNRLDDVRTLLRATWDATARYLRPETPRFTRRLGPGIAVADDPGPGRSHGEVVSILAAEGLWAGRDLAKDDGAGRLRELISTFRKAGANPAQPWSRGGVAAAV